MEQTIKHLHVICYKWGNLYQADYINTLANMVNRHLEVPYTLHCITDDPTGINKGINTHQLPNYGFEGIWRKLMSFQKDFLGLDGQYVLSIDLDVVIIDSINFVAQNPNLDFVIARNWSQSGSRGSGCIYRLKVGSHPEIWDRFMDDPEASINQHHGKTRLIGEQQWLDTHIKNFNYFPDGKVVSFKRHCRSKGKILRLCGVEMLNTARFGIAKAPAGAALISFHGDPSPHQVRDTHWGRWRKAPFVQEHWR